MAVEYKRIQSLSRLSTDYAQSNPVLLDGEIGVADTGSSRPTVKIGDGVRTWSTLPALMSNAPMYVEAPTTETPTGTPPGIVIDNVANPPSIGLSLPAGDDGTAAGADTQVQFNTQGKFDADPKFQWRKNTSSLYVGNPDDGTHSFVMISPPSAGYAAGVGVNGNFNGMLTNSMVNTNTAGNAAGSYFVFDDGGGNYAALLYQNAGAASMFPPNAPAGRMLGLYTWKAIPISIGTNLHERIQIDSDGHVTIRAAATAVAQTLSVTGPVNAHAGFFYGAQTNGESFGMVIQAGTTAADAALNVYSEAGAAYFQVQGDGGCWVGPVTGGSKGVGTLNAQAFFINGVNLYAAPGTWSGPQVFDSPTGVPVTITGGVAPTQALIVNGPANAHAALFNGASTSGQSFGVAINAGTTSTDAALSIYTKNEQPAFQVQGDGSIYAGDPAGGPMGPGTINAAGLFINGIAVGTPEGAIPPGNPTAKVGLAVVNGISGLYMRSDAAPPLDVSIAPTWTGAHTFQQNVAISASSPAVIGMTITNKDETDPLAGSAYSMGDGASNWAQWKLFNGASGAALPGGPTGVSVSLFSGTALPLVFGTNSKYRGQITAVGAWMIPAPDSGYALNVTGNSIFAGDVSVQTFSANNNTALPVKIINATGGTAYAGIQFGSGANAYFGGAIRSQAVTANSGTIELDYVVGGALVTGLSIGPAGNVALGGPLVFNVPANQTIQMTPFGAGGATQSVMQYYNDNNLYIDAPLTGTPAAGAIILRRNQGGAPAMALTIAATGIFTFAAPNSAAAPAVTMTGVAAQSALMVNSGNTTQGVADLAVGRVSLGTANALAAGANLSLNSTAGATQQTTILQQSGGQTELWQFNTGSGWKQIWKVGVNGGLYVSAPAAGTALSVQAVAGGAGIVVNATPGNWAASFYGAAGTTNQSSGIYIQAGTNSDYPILVRSADGARNLFLLYGSGGLQILGNFGCNGAAGLATQQVGWGTATGAAVIANYSGTGATLAQTAAVVADLINVMKAIGFFGA